MLDSPATQEMRQWSHEQALAERFALAVTQLNRLKGVLIRVNGRVTLGGTANDMIIAHRAANLDLTSKPLHLVILHLVLMYQELLLLKYNYQLIQGYLVRKWLLD